jgi:hypothetical protein
MVVKFGQEETEIRLPRVDLRLLGRLERWRSDPRDSNGQGRIDRSRDGRQELSSQVLRGRAFCRRGPAGYSVLVPDPTERLAICTQTCNLCES